jgi:hypothetical protein
VSLSRGEAEARSAGPASGSPRGWRAGSRTSGGSPARAEAVPTKVRPKECLRLPAHPVDAQIVAHVPSRAPPRQKPHRQRAATVPHRQTKIAIYRASRPAQKFGVPLVLYRLLPAPRQVPAPLPARPLNPPAVPDQGGQLSSADPNPLATIRSKVSLSRWSSLMYCNDNHSESTGLSLMAQP